MLKVQLNAMVVGCTKFIGTQSMIDYCALS